VTALAAHLSRREGRAAAVAVAVAVFLVSWGAIHRGFYAQPPVIVDTPGYQLHSEAILDGQVPYRDFDVEYPPGALPVFVVPAIGGDYASVFAWLMAALGAATVVVVARVRLAAAAFVAVSPLLVGSLLLSRFDLWPAALATAAVVALLEERHRLGWSLLGAAVAAKLWPLAIVPVALAWSRRHGQIRAVAWGAAVLALAFVPFVLVAPGGLWDSISGQLSRPLQIESLGASFVTTFGDPTVVTSHGSQNIPGHGWLEAGGTAIQIAVLLGVWVTAWRRPDELPRLAAAATAAFIAFGKVLSPQFLVWLVPLVPLVRGRRGVAATAMLVTALLLTQAWFPRHYWDYVFEGDLAWVVLARDVVLVALVAVLALPARARLRHR
jgi:hypothetical protein